MIGRTLGTFRIIEQIGMGGMATVYKAYDPGTDRFVAVKVLPQHYSQDPTFVERFRREAKAIARLEHPPILPIFAYGEDEGTAYLVMRYMEAGTLKERLERGPLALEETSAILSQVADALDYAHEHGVLHRDVKPSNVLLDGKGNAYLTDFGLAKMVESVSDLTGTGMALGTPQYMSPEQCRGVRDLKPATDIYSLGIVLYQMLTGQVPYYAETPIAILHKHLNDPLPLPRVLRPDLPESVEQVVLKALAKEPGQRFTSAGRMGEALASALRQSTAQAVTELPPAPPPDEAFPSATVPLPPERRRRPVWPWLFAAVGGVAALVVVAGVLALIGVFGGAPRQAAAPPTVAAEVTAAEPAVQPTDAPAQAPTAAPTPTERPEAEPTETPIPLGFPGNPVTGNGQWTPVIRELEGVDMALVPVGCFMMGSNASYGGLSAQPAHQQCFEVPFWIDVTEVTNANYGSSGHWSGPDYPRANVNWYEARDSCEARGARLPTEAEWEYAVRGPDSLVYPWGDERVADYIVSAENSNLVAAEVGSKPEGASWVGALDMLGNVWEWTSSLRGAYPYDAGDGREDTEASGLRVQRGGSYGELLVVIGSTDRLPLAPHTTEHIRSGYSESQQRWVTTVFYDYGFRCARDYAGE